MTLVESLASMLLVSGLVAVSLNLFGAAKSSSGISSQRGHAQLLAQDLMSEILVTAYAEPSGIDVVFGPELDELGTDRSKYDDVDDYDNWSASPPERRDGTLFPGHAGWNRSVEVKLVQPNNLGATTLQNQGVKRITITVDYNGVTQATLVGIRADSPILSKELNNTLAE